MTKKILINKYGDTRIDEVTINYYESKSISKPYTLYEDIMMIWYDPIQVTYAGEMIYGTEFFNSVVNINIGTLQYQMTKKW